MKRTRKWQFVQQDAQRLAELGLSPLEIAHRLGLSKSTVTRWMTDGRLPRTEGWGRSRGAVVPTLQVGTPEEWAASVRAEYDLDATDQQLVAAAHAALVLSQSAKATPTAKLNAIRTFQGIVKQLDLPTRAAEAERRKEEAESKVPEPEKKPEPVLRRTGTDPRSLLMAVK